MRIATLNARGLIQTEKRTSIATDFHNYKLDILCIQETHLKGTYTTTFKGEQGNTVRLYNTGTEEDSHHGVGILIDVNRKALFKRIDDRICYIKVLEKNTDFVVINAYAPTNQNTSDNINNTENFYQTLNDTINSFSKNTQVFIAGDFNSQIGTYNKEHPELIGKYYKGTKRDKNSTFLIDIITQNQLVVTNTHFKHKLAHITTWECKNKHRINPVRNQIDFILCKKNHPI